MSVFEVTAAQSNCFMFAKYMRLENKMETTQLKFKKGHKKKCRNA